MNATMDAPRRVQSHATNRAKVSDPFLTDSLAAATALSLKLSTTSLKQLEYAGEVSKSWASRWAKNGKGSPLYDVTLLVYRLMRIGQHAGMVVAHVMSILQQALMPTSDADLVARYWLLMGTENEAEGRENKAQAMYGQTGDLEAIERASIDEAGILTELAACCRELRRRRIDPRRFS